MLKIEAATELWGAHITNISFSLNIYIYICRLENIYYKLKIFILLTKYIYGLCEGYLTFIEYISTDWK